MNHRLQACLVLLIMADIAGAVFAQSGVSVPLQRGVSVQFVTERSNAATEERLKSGHAVGGVSIV